MASSIVSSKEKEELTENHPVVAAIDIGTTSTCFALSFANNPTKLTTSKWTSVSTIGDKAPTCVLLSPDKKFVAFGYDAEERYRTLLLEDKKNGDTSNAKAHYFFERFKIMLYQTKAGLQASSVKIILEPQAASLYCNEKRFTKPVKLGGGFTDLGTFSEGTKYIVADLGGETTALSIHEILPDRNLNRIHRADGDPLGGIVVNQGYSELLEDIFGSNVMQYLRDNDTDVMESFEDKKRILDFDKPNKIIIRIPVADIRDAIRELKEESIETKIKMHL